MKSIMVLFAVAAAAGSGYFVGDDGSFTIAAAIAGGAAAVALFLAWANSPARPAETVSLRPVAERAKPAARRATAAGQSQQGRRVLKPGELARMREQERLVAEMPEVAVRLADAGKNQIAVIKVLRNYLDLGLKEAKEFTDAARKGGSPLVVAEMAIEHAQQFARDIEAAGGTAQFEEPVTIR